MLADELAELSADWFAEFDPPDTLPPAMLTGAFPFTAFCEALASESAACRVAAAWADDCAWPAPPQP